VKQNNQTPLFDLHTLAPMVVNPPRLTVGTRVWIPKKQVHGRSAYIRPDEHGQWYIDYDKPLYHGCFYGDWYNPEDLEIVSS
jgi:hypothetical protein